MSETVEPWMLPGVFVICTNGEWDAALAKSSGIELPANPPKAGKVYTLSGAIRFPYGLVFALAEFPNYAFEAEHFKPTPHHQHALFRLMLQNPHHPPMEREITINGRVH